MIFRAGMFLLTAAALAVAAEPPPKVTKSMLVAAAVESVSDNISPGWCGRGMLSILQSVGLGKGLEGANGQDWEKTLMKAGWKPVPCPNPERAPLGSVLVYSGDARVGKRPRGTPGGYYGHVEMVAIGTRGNRLYVSDDARVAPGGTVRDNFTKRAWLPPGNFLKEAAPAVEVQVASVLQERNRMALEFFNRNSPTQVAQTQVSGPVVR